VAARCKVHALSAHPLELAVESRLGHGYWSLVSLRCIVLCWQGLCDELITRSSSAVCRKIDQGEPLTLRKAVCAEKVCQKKYLITTVGTLNYANLFFHSEISSTPAVMIIPQ
jgi:hypothetical protein